MQKNLFLLNFLFFQNKYFIMTLFMLLFICILKLIKLFYCKLLVIIYSLMITITLSSIQTNIFNSNHVAPRRSTQCLHAYQPTLSYRSLNPIY